MGKPGWLAYRSIAELMLPIKYIRGFCDPMYHSTKIAISRLRGFKGFKGTVRIGTLKIDTIGT
jgi:hypothetical protein